MFKENEKQIRKLARSSYWQSIYRASKDCNGIRLFDNDIDFAYYQYRMLYWLEVYSNLYESLATHEDDRLSEAVIQNEFRTDAYLTYKSKKNDFMWRKYRQEEKSREIDQNRKRKFKNPGNQTVCKVDLRRE